jgi:hypothetical protein
MKNFPSAHIFLALLIVCALCYAPLRAQTLDSTKADSVQKPRENWYWVHGSFFTGLGLETTRPSIGIPLGGEAGISIAFQKSIITAYSRGMFYYTGGGRGGGLSIIELYSATYGIIERTDSTFHSTSFGLSRIYSLGLSPIAQIGIIGEIQAGAKTNGIGVGWRLRANLNLETPYISAGVVLHLGWMP